MKEFKIKVVHGDFVNQLKLKMDNDICKIFINNGKSYAGIRLDQEKLKQLFEFVQCNIK